MVNMASTLSAIVVQSFIIVLALETVRAYVPYVPPSNYITYDDDEVDVQPYQRSADASIVYRYLNSLLLDNFINHQMGKYPDRYKALKRVPTDDQQRGSMEKRKVFWQPLGYLPAGVHPNGNQGPAAGGGSAGRGQVFRYGK